MPSKPWHIWNKFVLMKAHSNGLYVGAAAAGAAAGADDDHHNDDDVAFRIFDTEYDSGRVPPYNASDPASPSWPLK